MLETFIQLQTLYIPKLKMRTRKFHNIIYSQLCELKVFGRKNGKSNFVTINFYIVKISSFIQAKHFSTFTPFSLIHYSLWKSLSFIGLYKLYLSTDYSCMLLWQPLVFNFIANFDTLPNVPSHLCLCDRLSPLC